MNNDLISREALKKAIEHLQYTDDFCVKHKIDNSISLCMLEKIIDNAPTVEERPQGEWIINTQYEKPEGECSICHVKARLIYGVRYCPFCGAYMRPQENKN